MKKWDVISIDTPEHHYEIKYELSSPIGVKLSVDAVTMPFAQRSNDMSKAVLRNALREIFEEIKGYVENALKKQ